MKRYRLLITIAALALFGAGCIPAPSPLTPGSGRPLSKTGYEIDRFWTDVGGGVGRLEYRFAPDTDSIMTVYRFPADGFTWTFAHGAPQPVGAWATKTDATLTANGVYFDENDSPAGRFVSESKRIGKRSFDADRTGVVELSPTFRLVDTATETFDWTHATEAAQTYPFLIKDGKPSVVAESGKSARRTFIGVDTDGNRYLGIVPDAPVTLFELSALLVSSEIHWDRVLNLDGGPSSGLVGRFANGDEERTESLVPVPNVIVVEPK